MKKIEYSEKNKLDLAKIKKVLFWKISKNTWKYTRPKNMFSYFFYFTSFPPSEGVFWLLNFPLPTHGGIAST